MEDYKRLLLGNRAWVNEQLDSDPEYFDKMASGQNPEYLWIGCSDSRVPANVITGTDAGEVFVHRNIANLVIHTDFNMLSVLQYAVDHLKVKHIIVCGHYGCGGVIAAQTHKSFGIINKWLHQIKDTYRIHQRELELIESSEARTDKLVEFNVIEQVHNLTETTIIQNSWRNNNRPMLHGWVFDLKTGKIESLIEVKPNTPLEDIYKFDFDED